MAASSSRSNAIRTEDGYVVEPRGEHRATIVWLHDVHKDGYSSVEIVTSLNLRNIKWICLDSGTRTVDYTPGVGVPTKSWCSTNTMQDELDSAASRVAYKLAIEPANVVRGVGGIGQGAQVALNFAKWNAVGNHTISMRLIVIGIHPWTIDNKTINTAPGASTRASYQSILLIRGTPMFDPMVTLDHAKETAGSLIEDGFGEVSFVQFPTLRHEITFDVQSG